MIYDIYHRRADKTCEKISDQCVTIPDQSLPLKTLLERAQRGQLDVANYFRSPSYNSEFDNMTETQETPLDTLDAVDRLVQMQAARSATTQEEHEAQPAFSEETPPPASDNQE